MTSTTSSTQELGFPGISGLGFPHGDAAATDFEKLEEQLRLSNATPDIERLRRLDRDVHDLDLPALEQAIAPDLLIESLTKGHRDRFRRWTGARNALALVPLLLTWGFLAWASLAYREELATDGTKIDQPFLLLWEQSFGGSAIPPFSVAAAITCALLTIVLAMTIAGHRHETEAIRHESHMANLVDSAVSSLRVAVEHSRAAKTPVSAEDWALAAQRILNDTQDVLAKAVRQTAELVAANQEITTRAKETLEAINADSRAFVKDFSTVTTKTLIGLREENSQFIDRTANKAVALLETATAANRALIIDQMSPLVDDFRSTLAEFTEHHGTYRDSAVSLATSASAMDRSAAVLAGSTKHYTDVAESIDKHLDGVEKSQEEFTSRIATTTTSMGAAAKAMLDTTDIMRNDLKGDLEKLAAAAVDASAKIATVNGSLTDVSTSLAGTTSKLEGATSSLGGATSQFTALVNSMNSAAVAMTKAAADLASVVGTPGPRRWWRW